MKVFNNGFDSKSVSEVSAYIHVGPEPTLKNSSAGSARRTWLNLKMSTLVVCGLLALFTGGLPGKAGTQESDIAPGDPYILLQVTATKDDPFSGIWVLNLSKSKFPSQLWDSVLKSKITHMAVDASGIEIKQLAVLESDEQLNISVKARFDGKNYQISGAPDMYSVAFRRIGRDTIKAELKCDGEVIIRETGVISPDGGSLAVSYEFTEASGKPTTGIAVLEKK